MELSLLVWVVVGLVILGLAWLAFQIFQALSVDTKTMPLKERLAWAYPSIVAPLLNIEYENDELLYVLQGFPTRILSKLTRANIDHYVIEDADEFGFGGVVVRGKDLQQTLQITNFETTITRAIADKKDAFIVVVSTKDPQLRLESFLQKYLENLRAIHTDGDEKVLEKRRAYQDVLSRIVKLQRDEADVDLETKEAASSKERWAYKLYDDLQHHPDILRIDVQTEPGTIIVYTDDIVVVETGKLPSKENRPNKMYFLGKMIIKINLSSGDARYYHEQGKMASNTTHQAPHIPDSGGPCWGSHAEVVSRAVRDRNYLKAIQEAVNFVKWANTDDQWGVSAQLLKTLSQKEVEAIERGKLVRARTPVQNKKIPRLSETTKYVIENKVIYQNLLDKLKIKYLVIDDDHRMGITGLLITNAKNVNTFIEQIVKPNETLSVDATAQSGVRSIRFTVDDQQSIFVKLMLDSWGNKQINMIDVTKQQQEQLANELKTTRLSYAKTLAGQFKSTKQITNDKIQQGLFSFLFRDIYSQLIALPDIASVDVIGGKIVIFTNNIYVKEAKLRKNAVEPRYYELGPMRIEIDLSMREEPIKCFRQDGTLPRSDGLLQAPHVDKSGRPVWGTQELRVTELLSKLDVVNAVKETIKFLQVAQLDDARGMYVQYLPAVDILELPQLELSKKQTKEQWLAERKKAEEEQNTQQYEEILLTQTAGQPAQNK